MYRKFLYQCFDIFKYRNSFDISINGTPLSQTCKTLSQSSFHRYLSLSPLNKFLVNTSNTHTKEASKELKRRHIVPTSISQLFVPLLRLERKEQKCRYVFQLKQEGMESKEKNDAEKEKRIKQLRKEKNRKD